MTSVIRDYVCLWCGTRYAWEYVEKLYSMLERHNSGCVRLYVLTEPDRPIPAPMIKISLDLWPNLQDYNRLWWYKMQLFDIAKIDFPAVYLDLDVVLLDNMHWIWPHDKKFFWAVEDFRYLHRPSVRTLNSSVMSWDPDIFYWIWQDFQKRDLDVIFGQYHGDQDYLHSVIPTSHLKFFDRSAVKSWRWQIQQGGWDFRTRKPRGGITAFTNDGTKIIVFHGNPKPHQVSTDPLIAANWC